MAVKVNRKELIYYDAECDNPNCVFNSFEKVRRISLGPEEIRRAVRRHVERTGHTVTIESGASTTYIKDE